MDDLSPEQVAFNEAFDLARAPALARLEDVDAETRWQLARATVEALRDWQPEQPDCRLEQVEVAASGPHEGEPHVLLRWRQGTTRHLAVLSVPDLVEMADYPGRLHLPDRPRVDDWVDLLMLTVYEPHGRPPAGAEVWVHLGGVP